MTLAPERLGPTLCVGELLVEIVATTPGHGFREAQPLFGPYPSGAPAIFADQCARIAGRAAMVGAVGADDFGQVVLDRLAQDGVDVSAVARDADLPTGSAFVRYRPDGGRDFVFNLTHSAAASFGWTAGVRAVAEGAGHLHVMGSSLAMPAAVEVVGRAVEVVTGRGGSISLDPNLRPELRLSEEARALFERLVDRADLLLPSGEELGRAAGIAEEGAAVAALLRRGVGEIVLKRGAAGATSFAADGARADVAPFRVEEVDATGAGDCFGGAYVASRRAGMPVAEALRLAAAAGARNVTRRGPMEGAGTRDEVEAFARATPRGTFGTA